MGIIFLTALLFGGVVFFVIFFYDKKDEKQNEITKWVVGTIFAIFGMAVGGIVSDVVGKKIAEKYLISTPVTVLETVNLLPFSGSSGAYIVTGENNGKKVAWYLREEGLLEEPYEDIIDRNMIVFTNDGVPAKQLVKVNVGSFWKWFALIPNTYRFVIPAGGLQEGKFVKTYNFISVSE